MTLTTAQKRTLSIAVKDGSIIVGSIDKTPGVRFDVILKLAKLGLLRWTAPSNLHAHSEWIPTDEGRKLLT